MSPVLLRWARIRVGFEYNQMVAELKVKPATVEVKDECASVADGWLAAYAAVYGFVTNEVPGPTAQRRVSLPDLCS
ncbi:MAG: DUF4411 family protein [Caldilineaceae bacterium SB0661_bin_34]|nr:DUF4411 family protein [Caldilineaceae bacterium SB0661_bin_34]